ncbi:MAG TPA: hypothetical protein VLW85_12455 [Myxococcales bacterium]|nr:hypothetical protein [Myxococcales bacterium]
MPRDTKPFDDEDEPAQVLDWDRAMKKSLEREEPALPATGGARRAQHPTDKK